MQNSVSAWSLACEGKEGLIRTSDGVSEKPNGYPHPVGSWWIAKNATFRRDAIQGSKETYGNIELNNML
jgi:hypothetical protein